MYEYRCLHCGERFEKLRKIQDTDADLECPKCQAKEAERLLSSFATGGSGGGGGCGPSGGGSRGFS
jgi:putative FmdB family regulatory protein